LTELEVNSFAFEESFELLEELGIDIEFPGNFELGRERGSFFVYIVGRGN